MAEFVKIICVTAIMSTIARVGGRKNDHYMILMTGACWAGTLVAQGTANIITAIANFNSAVAENPIIRIIGKLLSFVF